MHSASHIHADSCTSHTSFLIFIWFAPHGTFGLSADRDNIILIIVLLSASFLLDSRWRRARKPTFLRSSAISFFLSFYFNFNFNFLILIFCLVTSFPSRKAGLIAGCTWPYSDVALGPYRLSSTVARLYHEFNSGVARLLRRQSAMFGRIPYWFIVIIYAFSSCTAAAQRLNVIIV